MKLPDQPDSPNLTIDEQLDRLEEGQRALARSIVSMYRESQKAFAGIGKINHAGMAQMGRSVRRTARLIEALYADHRLRRLEEWRRRLEQQRG